MILQNQLASCPTAWIIRADFIHDLHYVQISGRIQLVNRACASAEISKLPISASWRVFWCCRVSYREGAEHPHRCPPGRYGGEAVQGHQAEVMEFPLRKDGSPPPSGSRLHGFFLLIHITLARRPRKCVHRRVRPIPGVLLTQSVGKDRPADPIRAASISGAPGRSRHRQTYRPKIPKCW